MLLKKYAIYLLLVLFCASTVAVAGVPAKGATKKLLSPRNSTSTQNSKSLIPYAEGELLVQFVRGVDMNSVNQVAGSNSMSIKKRFRVLSERTGNEWVLMKSNGTTEQMILALKNHPTVAAISPNYRRYLDSVGPNDPRYSELWGLNNTGQTGGTSDADIDAPEAWQTTTGSSSVIVAVIDTGVCYDHPDLAANMWQNSAETAGSAGVDDDGNGYIDDIYGIDPAGTAGSTPDTDPMDGYGHGTHCSGTIGAVGDNGVGITGVNWTVDIMALKMFDDAGGNGYDSFAIECIEYCIDQKINYGQNIVAINASWGSSGPTENAALTTAINSAGAAGIVFCAAAGNDGTDNDVSPHWPSSSTSSNIISVMATNDDDGDGGMNYGATSVDVGAPGVGILSTVPPNSVNPSIFFDDMESGSGNWSTGGTNNSWAITTDNEFVDDQGWPPNPTNFWSDSPGVDYLVNTDSYLAIASDIDLSGYTNQRIGLSFLAAWILDAGVDNDRAYIEISNNSGSSWASLGECVNGYGYGYPWQSKVFEIPDAYKTANFRFRFRLDSDSTDCNFMQGWLIDDVGIGPYSYTNAYESWNGTSMATPHVAGAIGLIAAQYPAETVTQRIDRILNNVDALAALSGRCTTGGRLNVNGAMDASGTPSIAVVAPTNGDVLYVTDYTDITWSVSNATLTDVVLSYSTDGGSNYTSIGTVSNTGSYTWTIPDAITSNGKIKVASTDGTLVGESAGAFSIEYFSPTAGYTEVAYSILPSGDGGYIIGGYCDSITTGGMDILIYKLDADGRKVWRTNLGGVRDDYGFHIERTSDNGFVVVGYSSSYTNGVDDIILYKIDANGTYLWKKNFGGISNDYSSSVRETADGGLILLGSSESFTNGSYDYLIYKLDSAGNTVWQKNFGGTGWDYAGTVIQTTDGGYVMFGESNSFTNGGEDFLLFKLDSSGNKIARKNFGGTGSEWAYYYEPSGNAIVQTADGGYAFTGMSDSYTNGAFDIIVYRINHNGALLWKKNFGGAADDESYAIQQTADGGFILAGCSQSFTNGGEDFVIYKLDSDGNEVWHKNYGGTSDDAAFCIYQAADGNYVVAGYSVSFGTTPGYPDFLLYVLDADGNKIGRRNLGR